MAFLFRAVWTISGKINMRILYNSSNHNLFSYLPKKPKTKKRGLFCARYFAKQKKCACKNSTIKKQQFLCVWPINLLLRALRIPHFYCLIDFFIIPRCFSRFCQEPSFVSFTSLCRSKFFCSHVKKWTYKWHTWPRSIVTLTLL